ncbi:hypothetical protein ECANGB1_2207 [Enterospora canceri]|uniref:Uncharacterized protein n=1 Tax=Enterospora canceri TaxID=1081671 RepID=A0A1Y1S5L6_9MICR|nr:hypothetical protein ECANGB1_2207 [Enterospora canceri]
MLLHVLLGVILGHDHSKFDMDCPTCAMHYNKTGEKAPPSQQPAGRDPNQVEIPDGTEEHKKMEDEQREGEKEMQQLQQQKKEAEQKAAEAEKEAVETKLHNTIHAQKRKEAEQESSRKMMDMPAHFEYKNPAAVKVFTPLSIPFKAHQLLAMNRVMDMRRALADLIEKEGRIIHTEMVEKPRQFKDDDGKYNFPVNPSSNTPQAKKGFPTETKEAPQEETSSNPIIQRITRTFRSIPYFSDDNTAKGMQAGSNFSIFD